MIGFAKIAAGSPSSTSALADHLLNQTLTKEMALVSELYTPGMVHEPQMEFLSTQVADGHLTFSEALDTLMQRYIRDGGDLDLLDAAEGRFAKKLGEMAFRIQEGLENAPLAVIRTDMDPRVALGLGIEADDLLSKEAISALLAGRRTDGGKIEGKFYATERRIPVDRKTGEERYSTPIGSYDFCPSPDKSISVAWAFSNPVEQARIFNAHLEAAREAVAYIASEVGKTRLGKDGSDGAEPGHVTWLEFTHHTARRTQISVENDEVVVAQERGIVGDPEIHTHFLIPNAVFCESSKVGSLDTAAIGGFIHEADAFYHARLAQKLRDEGFHVELDDRTGAARMPVIPEDIRTLFSKRTQAGIALAKIETDRRGEVWDELSSAQQEARVKVSTQSLDQKIKGGKDDVANVPEWTRQAKAFGWEAPLSFQMQGPHLPGLSHEQRIRQAYEVALPLLERQIAHRSVVTGYDVRTMAARGLIHTGAQGLEDINAVTALMRKEGVVQYGERTALQWGQENGKRTASVTTVLHEAEEREFIRLARTAADDRRSDLPRQLLHRKIDHSGLDLSGDHGRAQRDAIERLGAGGRFSLVVAAAGAGKTTALQPLVTAWSEQNRPIYGASLGWRQADDLVKAGIHPDAVKAFSVLIAGIQDGSINLETRAVVAVDEWGLLGTRQALELLRLQEKHGFQVVALGDDKQCASIEAGAIIELTRRALGTDRIPEIETTKRQTTPREQEIAGLFREGRAAEALTMKREDGSAQMVSGGYKAVVQHVAELYAERLAAIGVPPAISAPTNVDAHRISEAVREVRRGMGLLAPDLRNVRATNGDHDYTLRLAVGDRVRLFRSTGAKYPNGHGGAIGRNGSILEVVAVHDVGLVLKTRQGRVGTVSWDKLTTSNGRVQLAYGYATTIHVAQGSDVREHIFALPAGSSAVNGRIGYTANTRHKERSYVVTNEAAEQIEVRKRRPINDPHPVTLDDKWANVARALAWQPDKDNAVDLLERLGKMKQGMVRLLHDSAPLVLQQHARLAPERVVERRQVIDLDLVKRQMRDISPILER